MEDTEVSPLKNFDKNLQQFYYDVIGKEVDLNVMWKSHSIRRALSEVVKAYKKRPRRKSDIRFDTPYRRCAYLLKHSPCFTSAVAKYFHTLVSERKNLIEDAFKSGSLAICCLGGGPATDAVAVIHIIRFLYRPYWQKHRQTLKINVTVADISEEWQDTAKNVLECLKMTPEFFGKGEISLTYEFLTADLSEKMTNEKLKGIIKSADIVTMIYFLSAVTGTRGRKTSEDMVENIMLQMKKGSFVFFLDSAVDKHYEILNKASEKRNIMQQIYGPLVEEFHSLSIESVESFLDLYAKHCHRLICMTYMFFCVSTWQKPKIRSARKYIRRELLDAPPPEWKKPTNEESDDLTQKMKQYRSSVYRLLNRRFNPNFKVKSTIGFKRDMGKNDSEKYTTDSKYTKNKASSGDFRQIDQDVQKSASSNNCEFVSHQNLGKTNQERMKAGSTNIDDFGCCRNFEKNDLGKWKTYSDSTTTLIQKYTTDSKYTKNIASSGDFRQIDQDVQKSASSNNCEFVSHRNLGKTNQEKVKAGSTKNDDFGSCRNFEKNDPGKWKTYSDSTTTLIQNSVQNKMIYDSRTRQHRTVRNVTVNSG